MKTKKSTVEKIQIRAAFGASLALKMFANFRHMWCLSSNFDCWRTFQCNSLEWQSWDNLHTKQKQEQQQQKILNQIISFIFLSSKLQNKCNFHTTKYIDYFYPILFQYHIYITDFQIIVKWTIQITCRRYFKSPKNWKSNKKNNKSNLEDISGNVNSFISNWMTIL